MRKLFIILMAIALFIIPLATAQDIYTYNTSIDLKVPCYDVDGFVCSSSASCNITINYPNETSLINGKLMNNKGTYHNYTLSPSQTQTLGEYKVYTACQDGADYGYIPDTFTITLNGSANPSAGVIVFFSIIYLLMVAFLLYAVIASLAHFVQLDMNVMDLVVVWSSYFVLVATFAISQQYLNNLMIQNFFELLIKITMYTNFIVPGFLFVICMIKRNLEFKKENPYG